MPTTPWRSNASRFAVCGSAGNCDGMGLLGRVWQAKKGHTLPLGDEADGRAFPGRGGEGSGCYGCFGVR